ncbi:MAG: VTT domain-containing protein [Planctomycetes bacterium]|nr:VTT domain-containing protein [Planctomycetota bacterium]
MPDWLHQLYSEEGIQRLIYAFGLVAIIGIVFAETGLLIGFFLPGDSLLFIGGVLCAINLLDPGQPPPLAYWTMTLSLCVAAIAGDWLNFWMGKWTGSRIWERRDGRFFKRRYLLEAKRFYEHHGGISLALARFIPIARTFVPFAAGMSRMPFRSFMFWNIGGAVTWVFAVVSAGYFFGQVPFVRKHLELIILSIVFISVLPVAVAAFKRWRSGPPAELAEDAAAAAAAGQRTAPPP